MSVSHRTLHAVLGGVAALAVSAAMVGPAAAGPTLADGEGFSGDRRAATERDGELRGVAGSSGSTGLSSAEVGAAAEAASCPAGTVRISTSFADGFESGQMPDEYLNWFPTTGDAEEGSYYATSTVGVGDFSGFFLPLMTAPQGPSTYLSFASRGQFPDTDVNDAAARVYVNDSSWWLTESAEWERNQIPVTNDVTQWAGELDILFELAPVSGEPTSTWDIDDIQVFSCVGEASGLRGDWTGGGTVDVLATTSTGALRAFPGKGDGSLANGATVGSGWKSMTYLGSPGDITGDDRTDLVARSSSGAMFLYAGRGGGLVSNGQQVGSGWNVMTALVTPGDLDGDGRPDLLARRTDGTLHHYRFGTTGALSYVRQVGTGWNGMAWMTGMGDINGDGFGDVLGVNSSGTMLRYWGSASGLRGGGVVGAGWGGMTWVTSPGDMNGDGRGDLLVRDSAANLRFYPGSATGVSNGRQVGSGWGGFSRIL